MDDKLVALCNISRLKLSDIFKTNPNIKNIVLEAHLISPLERICGAQWLKEQGFQKIYKIESADTAQYLLEPICYRPLFFMILTNFEMFMQVVNQIRSLLNRPDCPTAKNLYHIICVPRCLSLFEQELEELGLYSIISVHTFQWLPIILDDRILTMEMPFIYQSLYISEDYSFLPCLSRSLWELFVVMGNPQISIAVGRFSNLILKQIEEMNDKYKCTGENTSQVSAPCDFEAVILIDRTADYCSALLTSGVYAALLGEVFPFRNGICECASVDSKDSKSSDKSTIEPLKLNLDCQQDNVYAEIRYENFSKVSSLLRTFTKQLKDESSPHKQLSVGDMKVYMQTQLQNIQRRKRLIHNHINSAEFIIKDFGSQYEERHKLELNILSKDIDKSGVFKHLKQFWQVSTVNTSEHEMHPTLDDKDMSLMLWSLRIISLIFLVNPLCEDDLWSIWPSFIQRFGYRFVCTMQNLQTAEIVPASTVQTPPISLDRNAIKAGASAVLSKLGQTIVSRRVHGHSDSVRQLTQDMENVKLTDPICSSYVFDGAYKPLVTHITAEVLRFGTWCELQTNLIAFFGGDDQAKKMITMNINNDNAYPLPKKCVLVGIVGGVTYAEIAACHLLEKITKTKIYIWSDAIINGNSLMSAVAGIQ